MAKKTPGKAHREGIGIASLIRLFPDNDAARRWFEERIWPDGPHCPHCGSFNVQAGIKHRSMTHRCRDCDDRPMFTLRTGTVMQSSKLGYRAWAIALYLAVTSLKGVSSMKLHRDLEITQKSAWHLVHRIRKALESGEHGLFAGPVEADKTFVGGKRENMPMEKRGALTSRGTDGKTAVAGVKDRATKRVRARVVERTDKPTLQGFVVGNTKPDAKVYTDEAAGYGGIQCDHESVNHGVGEYVRGQAHSNGMESFWSMLKRGYVGTYHKMSPKHLGRYVDEFSCRHSVRDADTIEQMRAVATGMRDKRLRYVDLIVPNGLPSGARS